MAKYTMELRKVCDYFTRETVESWFKSYNLTDYLRPNEIETIEKAGLWNKDKLARKIVNHYFMREIGFETPALFKHYALVTMEEIMEQKLPLIYSSAIDYDPLVNVDFTETFERSQNGTSNDTISSSKNSANTLNVQASTSSNSSASSSGNSSSSENSENETMDILNNTPQQKITKQNIESGAYASSVTQKNENAENTITSQTSTETETQDKTTTTNNSTNNSSDNLTGTNRNTSTNDENYVKKIKGNSGVSATAQKMIEQYRQNIIAIDKEIIEELNTLFMGLY